MSIPKEKKADIIYTRLYEEYGNWSTWAEFAKEFGRTRQQVYEWRKSGNIKEREIKLVFPDINREWLEADTYEKLYEMPVKRKQARNTVDLKIESIKEGIAEIERHADDPETRQQMQQVFLEFLADHVKDLSDVLQRLVKSGEDSEK